MAVTDSSKDTLKRQRERLLLEMQHLEQTYKSGLLRLQEYTLAKKAVEKKISLLEQKQRQFEAKEKAVEEILGASSMLSSQSSKDMISQEKQHHKYFMKIEKPKTDLSQNEETFSKPAHFKDLSKPVPKKESFEKAKGKAVEKVIEKKADIQKKVLRKKEIADSIAQDMKQKGFQERKIQQKTFVERKIIEKELKQKEMKHKERIDSHETKKEKEQIPLAEHLHVPHQLPAASPSSLSSSALDSASSSVLSPPYKDIDELVEKEDSNWRFALAILTLFLLILLYVKFTSFGGSSDILTVDAYLDINSPYSKDMHGVLTELMSEYGQSLWISNHIVGSTPESILAGTAVACANQQNHGSEYLDYLFSQSTVFATDADALSVASTLGLNSDSFSSCLSDPVMKEEYFASQEEIASLDISYTPTLVINNKRIIGAVGYEAVKTAIDQEMTSLG